MKIITQKEKDDLVLLSHIYGATLNGRPAKIVGRLNHFASVVQGPDGLRVEYSWNAVARIMTKDRAFKA